MKKLISVLIFLALFVIPGFQHGDNLLQWHLANWSALLFIVCIALSLRIAQVTHWSTAPILIILFCGGIYAPFNRDAIYSAFSLLALVYFAATFRHENLKWLAGFLILFYVASCVVTFVAPLPFGYVGNGSVNGCLVAILTPFAFSRFSFSRRLIRIPLWPLGIVAVFMTGAALPVGVLAVALITYRFAKRQFTLAALYSIGAVLGAYLFAPVNFFSDSGRFETWAHIWKWSMLKPWFGQGTGTGAILFQSSALHEAMPRLNLWAHNDFLHLVFENGFVGLAALILFLFFVLRKSFSRPPLFASVCAFMAASFFNPMAHMPMAALVGVLLLRFVYWEDKCTHD